MRIFLSPESLVNNMPLRVPENAAQAAYLVGIADPASEPGRPGLVDQSQFSRASQAIQMACSNLTNPAASQQQVGQRERERERERERNNTSRVKIQAQM